MKLKNVLTNYFEHSDLSVGSKTNFNELEKRILTKSSAKQKSRLYPVLGITLFAVLLIFVALFFTKIPKENSHQKVTRIESSKFAHFQYLPEPQFGNAAPSSLAEPGEYSIKGTLPSAEKLVNGAKTKTSFIPIAYAAGPVKLPVYRANRHEMTQEDASKLAKLFEKSGEPKKDGTNSPGYYGFLWEDDKTYFQVTGGSGSGGFEFYLKDSGISGTAPSDEESSIKAKEFLTQKGLIDNTYIVLGIHHNTSSISKRTGFEEDHKEVYFRKKLEDYQVYDWNNGGGSATVDKIEVWVGVGGRIIYASYPGYWTTANLDNKTDYVLKEPTAAFEDLKTGQGKLAWIDYDAIGVSSGGVGPTAPNGNFVQHGKLRNVEIQSVDLAYYHQPEDINNPEYFQPIYLFRALATLDWKNDYLLDNPADKLIQGKRTEVVLVAPAISGDNFFDGAVDLTEGKINQTAIPVYYPETNESKGTFLLKLGAVTDLENPKRNIYLSWEDVKGTTKYNILLKAAGDKEYVQLESIDGNKLSKTISVNQYIDYYIKIQACDSSGCSESNEIFLPQEQKPTFYLKLGTIIPRDDPKTEVYLSWSEYPGATKYNIYQRNSQTEQYKQALDGVGGLSYTATVNRHNDNYFIIQACSDTACYPSNELFLPKE
ncbi:MAG TPA: hypothetical protein VLG67_03435 [Candidatus Saccharimonadales bacterium]|nr:hypothetical protein [Candidatus Saccharimonadales bacterium]